MDRKRLPSLVLVSFIFGAGWIAAILAASITCAQSPAGNPTSNPPNIIVIFVDDLGYGDVRPFGETKYPTRRLEQMAREGRRFTDFVVSSAVCSASRAAILTGCYHTRVGIHGALGPSSQLGIAANEVTLGELCKSRGYATACIGKWHLGHQPQFSPNRHGFDYFYGLPYSNDMWPFHPDYVDLPADAAARKRGYPDLPLIENDRVLNPQVTGPDQARLIGDYTDRALTFIEQHREQPFLVYLAHSMVHVPLFVSEGFAGKSEQGLFADVMLELDASVGRILDSLHQWGLTNNTLVVFTSDNGPWLSYGNHAGSSGGLREGKGTSFEGGVRVPTIMWWPGKIPAGSSCDELASTIDVLPTVAGLIGAKLPAHPIDGRDLSPQMFATMDQPMPESPHPYFYYYYGNQELQAVRDRRWKLMLPHEYRTLGDTEPGHDGKPSPYRQVKLELSLFDLKSDPGERENLIDRFPAEAERLLLVAEQARVDLGDRLTERPGQGIRPPDRVAKE